MYEINDNELGSILRLAHSTLASMIYLLIFTHMGKAMFYGLVFESAHWVWWSGFLIFLLLIVLTFLGYVLPLSQMSYWGLTVFSNILSTIPSLGNLVIYWFWGGEFINGLTLLKVHVLHIVLPLVLLGLVVIHMYLLHQYLSSDSIDRFVFYNERIMFMYWFYFRDLNIMLVILIMLLYGILIYWSFVFHEESFIIVNTQKTPEKVMPEWWGIKHRERGVFGFGLAGTVGFRAGWVRSVWVVVEVRGGHGCVGVKVLLLGSEIKYTHGHTCPWIKEMKSIRPCTCLIPLRRVYSYTCLIGYTCACCICIRYMHAIK